MGDRESRWRLNREAVGVIEPLPMDTRSSRLEHVLDDIGEGDLIRASEWGLGVLSNPKASVAGASLSALGKLKVNAELSCPAGVPPVKKQYLEQSQYGRTPVIQMDQSTHWLINSR